MDPNKALKDFNLTLEQDAEEAYYIGCGLESWISNGGFSPTWELGGGYKYFKNRMEILHRIYG